MNVTNEEKIRTPARAWQPHRANFVVLFCSLMFAGCVYEVDTTIDLPDADPGDGVCTRIVPPGTESIPGRCSLRAAIQEANAGLGREIIELPAGEYSLDLPVERGGGSLVLRDSVRIQGVGSNASVIRMSRHSGLEIAAGAVELNHLALTRSEFGGLIVSGGAAELNYVTLRDNTALGGRGGGLTIGPSASATVRHSSIINNQAAFGGGINNAGTLVLEYSTVANNRANRTAGVHNVGTLIATAVTISGNANYSATSGLNGAYYGSETSKAMMMNVTITGNVGMGGDRAAGLYIAEGGELAIHNSVVADNVGQRDDRLGMLAANDCTGRLHPDSSYTLIEDATGCVIPDRSTFVTDMAAPLGALVDNGGPTWTHLPLTAPIVDGGPAPGASRYACSTYDQRGVPRARASGGLCELGAVERNLTDSFITQFVLVNAASGADIRPLRHGDLLTLAALPPQLSIRAEVSGKTGSVVFDYDGTTSIRTDNLAPYAIASDDNGRFLPFPIEVGEQQLSTQHTLRATPYTAPGGAGYAGGSLGITFEVRP